MYGTYFVEIIYEQAFEKRISDRLRRAKMNITPLAVRQKLVQPEMHYCYTGAATVVNDLKIPALTSVSTLQNI